MAVYPNVDSGDRLGACLATCDTLGRILDRVSDGIITIDRRMRVISLNRAAEDRAVLLEELLTGKKKGRTSDKQISYSERGNIQGAQFSAVAGKVYERAKSATFRPGDSHAVAAAGYQVLDSVILFVARIRSDPKHAHDHESRTRVWSHHAIVS
jgi:PAS domain-containing protein